MMYHDIPSYELSRALAKARDDLIRECINARIGRTDWKLESLGIRVSCQVHKDDNGNEKFTVWSLDGAPLIKLFPVTFRMEGYIFHATFNHQRL